MSMPKDFSQDGASGAVGGAANTANLGNGTQQISPQQAAIDFGAGALGNGALAPQGWGGEYGSSPMSDAQASQQFGSGALAGGNLSLMFEDGGIVPDDPSADPYADGGQPQDPNGEQDGSINDRIALALTSVDSALAYGRQKNGLPADGGMDEGNGSQQAAAMPMIPGNQSETPGPYVPQRPKPQQMAANMPAAPASQSDSGVKPIQPQPGPLAPTSNPFGQRQGQPYGRVADAAGGQSQDTNDDDTPTIPTDEETA